MIKKSKKKVVTEEMICETLAKKNRDKILKQINDVSDGSGNLSRTRAWKRTVQDGRRQYKTGKG